MPKAKPKAKAKAEPSGEQQTADEELELFDAGGFAFGGAGRFEDVTGDTEVATTTPKKPKAKAKAGAGSKPKPASPSPASTPAAKIQGAPEQKIASFFYKLA